MKSIFWISTAALALSGVAGATSLNCVPYGFVFPNAGGTAGQTASLSCPGFTPDPGFDLTSVTLNYVADYEFATVTPAEVLVTFTPTGLPGVLFTPNTAVIDMTGGFNSPAEPTASAIAGTFNNSSFAGGFTVSVTSKVLAGTINDSGAGVTVDWTETAKTPEPATMGLLGASLISLGLIRNRRKKAQLSV